MSCTRTQQGSNPDHSIWSQAHCLAMRPPNQQKEEFERVREELEREHGESLKHFLRPVFSRRGLACTGNFNRGDLPIILLSLLCVLYLLILDSPSLLAISTCKCCLIANCCAVPGILVIPLSTLSSRTLDVHCVFALSFPGFNTCLLPPPSTSYAGSNVLGSTQEFIM